MNSEHFGKYLGTPHQTIEQICDTARRRVAGGESAYVVIEDLVEGYCLGWGSANWELVDRAARGWPLAGCPPLPKIEPLPPLAPMPAPMSSNPENSPEAVTIRHPGL